jgi:hypothetical protein
MMADGLGLAFAGIDLKLTPDGEVYCFEVNPCPPSRISRPIRVSRSPAPWRDISPTSEMTAWHGSFAIVWLASEGQWRAELGCRGHRS